MNKFRDIKIVPKLSLKQRSCLSFIAWFVLKYKDYPTQREISTSLGLRSNSAWSYTEALVKKGYLIKDRDVGVRNLRLTDIADELLTKEEINNWDRRKLTK